MSMPHELYKTTRLGNDSKYTIGPYIQHTRKVAVLFLQSKPLQEHALYISSRPLVAQNPFWFCCCCWLVVSYRQGHYLTWTQFLLEEWASKIILFCMPRVSHQPLRAQKNSNFFVLPYLLSQFYIIALKIFLKFLQQDVSIVNQPGEEISHGMWKLQMMKIIFFVGVH